jgi:hypothetical protein
MPRIVKVIRCLSKGDYAIIEVELDHGGAAEVYVGGEGTEIDHRGKCKFYITPPWARPKQSRK